MPDLSYTNLHSKSHELILFPEKIEHFKNVSKLDYFQSKNNSSTVSKMDLPLRGYLEGVSFFE